VHRWIDHTAEVQLDLEAASEGELLSEAAAALGELADEDAGEPAAHNVTVEARDRPALLAELLSELVFLSETEGFVPDRLEAIELGERTLRARASGRRGHPRQLVKAVTYHGLRFEREGDVWRGSVVLDV
jgi:SHS2 domain-containing protein